MPHDTWLWRGLGFNPGFVSQNSTGMTLVNVMQSSELGPAESALSCCPNNLPRQLRITMLLANNVWPNRAIAALLGHVAHVVNVSSQEQMRWADTGSNVAFVEYKQFRHLAIFQKPCYAVRRMRSALIGKLAVSTHNIDRRLPQPTTVRFQHLRPKSFLHYASTGVGHDYNTREAK